VFMPCSLSQKGEPRKEIEKNGSQKVLSERDRKRSKGKNGTVFKLRYRKRKPGGGWTEVTETLRDCPSKKVARRVLDERLQQINASKGGATSRLRRFAEILGSVWPHYLDAQNVKGSTRYTWSSIIQKWIMPFFEDRVLDDIEPSEIGDFMSQLKSKNLATKYQRNIYNILKLMLDVARENGSMRANPIRPKIHRPKNERKEKPTFSVEQAKSILSAVDTVYRAALVTLALTGIRAGELLGLRWFNFDFLHRRITITHSLWRGKLQTTKTEARDRTLAMPEPLVKTLLDHRSVSNFTKPEDFVFCQADGRPMDPDSLRRYGIYPALEAAGVPYRKRVSGCHAFRHLVGSVIHRETGSIKLAQKQLGHSNISTTADIYTHVDDREMDQAASVLGRVLGAFCGQSVVKTAEEPESVQSSDAPEKLQGAL
jgi:integrase